MTGVCTMGERCVHRGTDSAKYDAARKHIYWEKEMEKGGWLQIEKQSNLG